MKTRAKRFVSALLAGVLCLSLLAGCASKKKELTRYSTVFYPLRRCVHEVSLQISKFWKNPVSLRFSVTI